MEFEFVFFRFSRKIFSKYYFASMLNTPNRVTDFSYEKLIRIVLVKLIWTVIAVFVVDIVRAIHDELSRVHNIEWNSIN